MPPLQMPCNEAVIGETFSGFMNPVLGTGVFNSDGKSPQMSLQLGLLTCERPYRRDVEVMLASPFLIPRYKY